MVAASPIKIAVESVSFYVRNVRMRLPFRYGKASLTAAPLLHTKLVARDERGGAVIGVSADMLPPKWFDKAPDKDFRRNISDLVLAAKTGVQAYLAVGNECRSPFDIWREAYELTQDATQLVGLNALTGSLGSSIIERALIDAAGKAANRGHFAMLQENLLGIEPGVVHEELSATDPTAMLPREPSAQIALRHTIGLGDPILDSAIPLDERLNDGIPQSVEGWIREGGVRYFKVKICADIGVDLPRLVVLATLLDATLPGNYQLTLDGNEQFQSVTELTQWYGALSGEGRLRALLPKVLFIEQPIERSAALSEVGAAGLPAADALPAIIIDESDDRLEAFKIAASLGYRGVSVKNCKGVFHGLLNSMLVDLYTRDFGKPYILSAEDLCNQPIVPLQQDLCAVSALGITHVERNGHHYCGTLDHVSPAELDEGLRVHGRLYESFRDSARLRVRDGMLDLRSLSVPGFGIGIETDFDSMTPLNEWEYESLDL